MPDRSIIVRALFASTNATRIPRILSRILSRILFLVARVEKVSNFDPSPSHPWMRCGSAVLNTKSQKPPSVVLKAILDYCALLVPSRKMPGWLRCARRLALDAFQFQYSAVLSSKSFARSYRSCMILPIRYFALLHPIDATVLSN